MALASDIHSRNLFRAGLGQQTTWGTANTTENQFVEMFVTDVVVADFSGVIRDEQKRTDGKRVLSHTDVFLTTVGAEYTISMTGIATLAQIGLLLYGVMQDIATETDSGVYTKVFEWDGATTGTTSGLPNKFFTIRLYDPATDEGKSFKDCVLKSLTLSADPGSAGGRITYKADFWTGSVATLTGLTIAPADWTDPDNVFFTWSSITAKTIAGAGSVLNKWSLTFENNCTRVGYDTSGNPQFIHFPEFKITGEMGVKYDADTKDALATFLTTPDGGSAEAAIVLTYGTALALGHLSFEVNAIYTGPPALDFGNAAGVFQTLAFQGVDDGTNEAIEVTLADGQNRAWIT